MLTAAIKKQIRTSFEAAKIQLSNFSNRSSQNKMIAEIARTLSGEYPKSNPILCVEAPTGTGKTMAYLISCLPIAKGRAFGVGVSSNIQREHLALFVQRCRKFLKECCKQSTCLLDLFAAWTPTWVFPLGMTVADIPVCSPKLKVDILQTQESDCEALGQAIDKLTQPSRSSTTANATA